MIGTVLVWLAIFGCRTTDLVAQTGATATRTATRTVPRPTFTSVPPTAPPTNTALPAKPGTVRTPTPRVAPSRTPIPSATIPLPPTSTPDPYAGFAYKPSQVTCVSARDTRIQGTVYTGGQKQNNVWVHVSAVEAGPASIPDFLTGTDPKDPKHIDGALAGQYRLGLSEGGYIAGTWFVSVLHDKDQEAISPQVRVITDGGPGKNICTVDFSH